MTFFRKIWNADETNGNTTDVVQNVEDTNLDNEYGLVGSSILYGRIDSMSTQARIFNIVN